MASKKSWTERIPSIVKALEESRAPFLQRADVEQIFQIGRTQANSVMDEAGAAKSSDAMGTREGGRTEAKVISRTALIVYLVRDNSEVMAREIERRKKLAETLAEANKDLPLQVERPIPRKPQRKRLDDLANVLLTDSELRIQFSGAADLLVTLKELSMAIGYDYGEFEARVGGAGSQQSLGLAGNSNEFPASTTV